MQVKIPKSEAATKELAIELARLNISGKMDIADKGCYWLAESKNSKKGSLGGVKGRNATGKQARRPLGNAKAGKRTQGS